MSADQETARMSLLRNSPVHPCSLCVRRMRHEGGNGSCPVFSRGTRRELGAHGQIVERKLPLEESWRNHLRLWPDGCVNFLAGDRRRLKTPPSADQIDLF